MTSIKQFKFAVPILLFLGVIVGVVLVALQGQPADPAPRIDVLAAEMAPGSDSFDEGRAPEFELQDIDGETFRLSDHDGKVIALNFWATWCAPCRIEIPHFIEIQDELRDEGVLFVGISLDHEGEEVVRAFSTETGMNYPVIIDDGSVTDEFGGIYALPTTILIDRRGHVMRRIPGLVTRDVIMPMLEELMGS